MSSRRSRYGIWGLLALTLSACAWIAWEDRTTQDVETASGARANASPANGRSGAAAPTTDSANSINAVEITNLFAAHRWIAPTAAPVSAPPARTAVMPPPVEPPAFEVAAVWRFDDRQPIVVLAQHGQTWVMCATCDAPGRVRPGETFAGGYRLERVDADSLTYTLKAISRKTTLPLPTPVTPSHVESHRLAEYSLNAR